MASLEDGFQKPFQVSDGWIDIAKTPFFRKPLSHLSAPLSHQWERGKASPQHRDRCIIIRLIADFSHALNVEDAVIGIEHKHCTRGQAGQRAFG